MWRRVRPEHVALAAIVVFAVVMRIAWRARTLTTWDSVLFALALDEFDVYRSHPHAPGYPVYIAVARVLEWLAPDANAALVAVSVLFSAATLVVLYRFVKLSAPAGVALATVFVFSLAPVFVYNGVIATSYTAEAFFSVLLALVAWRLIRHPSVQTAAWIGVLFALAVGVRTSLLFFLAPLVAVAVLWPVGAHLMARMRQPQPAEPPASQATTTTYVPGIKQTVVAGTTAAAVAALWFVPMVVLSGGWSRYWAATSYQSREVVFAEAVWRIGVPSLVDHAARLAIFLRHETHVLLPVVLGLGVVTMAAWLWRRPGTQRQRTDANRDPHRATAPPVWFYALWVVPSLLFYLFVFNGWGNGPSGYVLVFLPALYALGGVWAYRAARTLGARLHHDARWAHRSEAAVAVLAVLILLAPAPLLAQASHADVQREVRAHDRWAASWSALSATFDPSDTAILTTYSWAHVKWYHPDHLAWRPFAIPDREGGLRSFVLETHARQDDRPLYQPHVETGAVAPHPIPDRIERIVLFDFQIAGENGGVRILVPEVEVQESSLDNGWRVLWFTPLPDHPTIEDHLVPLDPTPPQPPS